MHDLFFFAKFLILLNFERNDEGVAILSSGFSIQARKKEILGRCKGEASIFESVVDSVTKKMFSIICYILM